MELNEIERDIRAEDFPDGTVQRDIMEAIAEHGRMAGPYVLKIITHHTHERSSLKRLSWPSWATLTRAARNRDFERECDNSISPGPHKPTE